MEDDNESSKYEYTTREGSYLPTEPAFRGGKSGERYSDSSTDTDPELRMMGRKAQKSIRGEDGVTGGGSKKGFVGKGKMEKQEKGANHEAPEENLESIFTKGGNKAGNKGS